VTRERLRPHGQRLPARTDFLEDRAAYDRLEARELEGAFVEGDCIFVRVNMAGCIAGQFVVSSGPLPVAGRPPVVCKRFERTLGEWPAFERLCYRPMPRPQFHVEKIPIDRFARERVTEAKGACRNFFDELEVPGAS
jgi:hypothetical protein